MTRLLAVVVALAAALVLCAGAQASFQSLAIAQGKLTLQAAGGYATHYQAGMFEPADYDTATWEKYQVAAVADATLGVIPSVFLTAAQLAAQPALRASAAAVVNLAIAAHQLPSGEWNAGTATAGDSMVSGTFWGEAEGEIALLLAPYVTPAQTGAWAASMEAYANYLSTTQVGWYANGNVMLREAVVMLETWKLTGLSQFETEYDTARAFVTSPGGAWASSGWRTAPPPATSGWFTESVGAVPGFPLVCANGQVPCDGFDPNYTAAQLEDLIVADQYDPTWLPYVQAEYQALAPLIDTATSKLDAAGGSRDNIASETFYPPVWEFLETRRLAGADEAAWSAQLAAMGADFANAAAQPDPGPNPFSLAGAAALGLSDILNHI